jgi:4a-hydroxytetrahydrobiopterin dehydratase
MQKARLTPTEVTDRLQALEGWREVDGKLQKEFHFASFADAFSFMTRVAFAAEAMDHHPDWSNSYRKVVIELSSHDVGGISVRDFERAQVVETSYRPFGQARTGEG